VCVCVFVCSCLEDMHKNALHFRFSLMRVCWWALFSALVFRKQWFPICPPSPPTILSQPLPPRNIFPFGLPIYHFPSFRSPFWGGKSGIAPSLFYALSKVSLHILRQFCRLQLCMYYEGEGAGKKNQNNQNKNNQLRFVVEKLQNYAKVRRPPTIQTPPNFIRLWKAYFPCLAGVCQSFSQPRWTDR